MVKVVLTYRSGGTYGGFEEIVCMDIEDLDGLEGRIQDAIEGKLLDLDLHKKNRKKLAKAQSEGRDDLGELNRLVEEYQSDLVVDGYILPHVVDTVVLSGVEDFMSGAVIETLDQWYEGKLLENATESTINDMCGVRP